MFKPLVIAAVLTAALASPVFAEGADPASYDSQSLSSKRQVTMQVPCPHKPADCPMYGALK